MAKAHSGQFRYKTRILRPTKNPEDGGREGQPEVVQESWYCSNEASTGREMAIAREITPLATHVLKGWNPRAGVKETDYVELEGKRLNIEFVDDLQENGMVLMLVCIAQA